MDIRLVLEEQFYAVRVKLIRLTLDTNVGNVLMFLIMDLSIAQNKVAKGECLEVSVETLWSSTCAHTCMCVRCGGVSEIL